MALLRGPGDPNPPDEGGFTLVFGPIPPHGMDSDRILQVYIDVSRGGDSLQWELVARPHPPEPPPPHIAERATRLGGSDGLLRVIEDALETSAPRPVARFVISAELSDSQYVCNVLPLTLPPEGSLPIGLAEFAEQVRMEHIGFRFVTGLMGVEEAVVTYFHERRTFRIVVQARSELHIANSDGRWAPFADDVLSALVPRLFTVRKDGDE